MLTAEQMALVRSSYALIGRSAARYSELFYHRLFLRHPFARVLFPDDMTHQTQIFEKTIDMLVANVGEIARLRSDLSDLARRHVGYGVQKHQYAAVGAVLIDTFAEILETDFTSDTRLAWERVYAEAAAMMIAHAYPD